MESRGIGNKQADTRFCKQKGSFRFRRERLKWRESFGNPASSLSHLGLSLRDISELQGGIFQYGQAASEFSRCHEFQ